MGMVKFFFKIFLLTFVVGIVIAIFFFSKGTRNSVFSFINKETGSVKGASTKRAQEVTGQIASDIGDGYNVARKQVLNLKVSDALNSLNRLQKVPQDFASMEKFVQGQINNFLSHKK